MYTLLSFLVSIHIGGDVFALHIESQTGARFSLGYHDHSRGIDLEDPLLSTSQDGSRLSCDNTCKQSAIGIKESLSTVPRRHLTAMEKHQFDTYGVTVLRSVITNQRVLKQIAEEFWKVNTTEGLATWIFGQARKMQTEKWNAGSRALMEDELLAEIAASVTGYPVSELKFEHAAVFPSRKEESEDYRMLPYHYDDTHRRSLPNQGNRCKQITLWVALTDALNPLEFFRKSHTHRQEIFHSNCTSWMYNSWDKNLSPWIPVYHKSCLKSMYENADDKDLAWTASLKPGDAFLFTGDTLHATVLHPDTRLGIALKYRAPGGDCPYNITVPPGCEGEVQNEDQKRGCGARIPRGGEVQNEDPAWR